MKLITKYVCCALVVLAQLVTAGCSGSLFKVKSPAALSRMPSNAASANLGSISFQAAPLLTDEETQELFESNLQLAGLLPLRIAILHNGGETIEVKKLRFQLHDGSGTDWKVISARKAVSHILKANDVYLYNPNSRKTFEKEFRAYELDLKSPLAHAERRREGLLIFVSGKKESVSSPRNLVLTIEGLSQPVSLNLN